MVFFSRKVSKTAVSFRAFLLPQYTYGRLLLKTMQQLFCKVFVSWHRMTVIGRGYRETHGKYCLLEVKTLKRSCKGQTRDPFCSCSEAGNTMLFS